MSGPASTPAGPVAQEPPAGFDPAWLDLREPADAEARAGSLIEALAAALGPRRPLVVHDLGSGTGSMARWLAPRLPGPQQWVLHDHDPALLAEAAARCSGMLAADGQPVGIETRQTDVTRLDAAGLAGAGLVTASALLDLLTVDEVDRIAAACAGAGCPALLTLSVSGLVELDPPDELDTAVAAAFDAHQRRTVAGRRLLGPNAWTAAADAFGRHGMAVVTAPSPWRLGTDRSQLTARWLHGWVAAAVDQEPGLPVAPFLLRRLSAADRLTAAVHHRDLLARPRAAVGSEAS